MTDTKQDAAAMAIEKADALVQQFAQKIAAMADQYGEPAWELAKVAARVDAASALKWPAIFTIVAVPALFILPAYLKKKRAQICDDDPAARCDGEGLAACTYISACLLSVVSFFAIGKLINLWAWAGLFQPEIWMAKKALGL